MERGVACSCVQCRKPARQLYLADDVLAGPFKNVATVDDVLAGLHARAEVTGREDDLDHTVRSRRSTYVYVRWS